MPSRYYFPCKISAMQRPECEFFPGSAHEQFDAVASDPQPFFSVYKMATVVDLVEIRACSSLGLEATHNIFSGTCMMSSQ